MAQSNSHAKHPSEHHIMPTKNYFLVFGGLIILTIVTVGAAYVHLGQIGNVLLAMFLASGKAALVLLYFMHLKYETLMNKIIFFSGFGFLSILLFFCGADIFTRGESLKRLPVAPVEIVSPAHHSETK
jgi:cytochrome c oxidase subunit 4